MSRYRMTLPDLLPLDLLEPKFREHPTKEIRISWERLNEVVDECRGWKRAKLRECRVYILWNKYDEPVYVGRTKSLEARIIAHKRDGKDFCEYSSIEVDENEANEVEQYFITYLSPEYNKAGTEKLLWTWETRGTYEVRMVGKDE